MAIGVLLNLAMTRMLEVWC